MSLFPRHVGRDGRVVVHLRLKRETGPPVAAYADIKVRSADGATAARFSQSLLVPPGATCIERYWTVIVPADAPLGRWDVGIAFHLAGRRVGSATAEIDHFFVEHIEPTWSASGHPSLHNSGPEAVTVRLFPPYGTAEAKRLTLAPAEIRPLPVDWTDAAAVTVASYADGRVLLLAPDGGPTLIRAPMRDQTVLAGLSGPAAALWTSLAWPQAQRMMETRYGTEPVRCLIATGLLLSVPEVAPAT